MTNADLDHVLGVFALREGGPLNIYAADIVRKTLTNPIGLDGVLKAFCGVQWHRPSEKEFVPIKAADGSETDLSCRAIALPGKPPQFAKKPNLAKGVHSLAWEFRDSRTNGSLLVAPDVAEITAPLRRAMELADAVIFDGTFWSAGELGRVKRGAVDARKMGHVPVRDESLGALAKLRARTKVYIHINNTNPILAADSAERARVEKAGIIVGEDGFEFEV